VSDDQHKLPPQNLEAEMSVLGAVFLDGAKALGRVIEMRLSPDDFYRAAHKTIYEAMLRLADQDEPIDLVSVSAELRKHGNTNLIELIGGSSYLAGLVDYVPTSANIGYYVKQVIDASVRRQVIEMGTEIIEAGRSAEDGISSLDQAESFVMGLRDRVSQGGSDVSSAAEILRSLIKEYERRYEHRGELTGLTTGYPDMDALTSGWQPSDLIILAARPSMGKTALALNLADNAKGNTLFFSLEMSKSQLFDRLVAMNSKVSLTSIRGGTFSESDWPRLTVAFGDLVARNLYVDDTAAISLAELRAKARRVHMKNKLDLIVIDYLQLMTAKAESRFQEVSAISRGLKALAKELNVPVIALSQLSRSLESRQDKRPVMSDLRESGQIEQDADVIAFIYRDAVYCEQCKLTGADCGKGHIRDTEVIFAKQRNGPIGAVKLLWRGEVGLFKADTRVRDYNADGSQRQHNSY